MNTKSRWLDVLALFLLVALLPLPLRAGASDSAKRNLRQLLLGKDVKALTQLPATKEGVNVYYTPPSGKNWDSRGLNVKDLTKWLKERGVGVESNEVVTITDVKIGGDMVEIHLGGGGMGRRGSKHAQETTPGFQRAGGSRLNLRYGRGITDADLQPSAFLDFLGRLLDVSPIREEAARQALPPEVRRAIESKTVAEGMTYQMVLLSFGEPEQNKINDSEPGTLSENWYYMKDGHRWVLMFTNGKVTKIEKY
jgi:hypothetical protein